MTDTRDTPPLVDKKIPNAKEKALAEALRQNLMKRKQQARARDVVPPTNSNQKEDK